MLVDFFNSLDPYKFFAEAPLFLLFFVPGIIAGAILLALYCLIAFFEDDDDAPAASIITLFTYVFWLCFLGSLTTDVCTRAGINGGFPIVIAVIASLVLNSIASCFMVALMYAVRASFKKVEK
jgi:hypothetical protein